MRLILLAVLPLIAACAMQTPPAPSTETTTRELSLTTRAVVQEVDQVTRSVILRTEEGKVLAFRAGDAVRNLPQLKAGDVVLVDYVEAVVARMAEPGDPERDAGVAAVGRAPEGSRPGGFVASSREVVVEVVAYDPVAGVGVVRNPEGEMITVLVTPEMRAFAGARKPGDRVALTITEALAISIAPVPQ